MMAALELHDMVRGHHDPGSLQGDWSAVGSEGFEKPTTSKVRLRILYRPKIVTKTLLLRSQHSSGSN